MIKIALLTLAALPALALTGTVETRNGKISGAPGKDASVTVFKGVPYAAPPVGNLRWQAPKPPANWEGVRKADAFSPSCIQSIVEERKPWTHEFMSHDQVSEDCLYLNIWTAAKNAGAKLPVFVYIHGGGFSEGAGSIAVYDGEGLAKKGLVMVTINYRMGVFGFFSHPELTKESDHNASGNQGLLDVVAALDWIRDNITAFGGDPSKVTIAGQSAGGMAVHDLIASPIAKGLFQRGIAESGGSTLGGSSRKLADAEADGERFAETKGAKSLADLRALTPEQLAARPAAAAPAGGGRGVGGGIRFGPIIDGYLLPASVDEIVAQGKQNDVPILTGVNADEGGASPNPGITLEAFQSRARQRLGDQADAFLKVYPATSDAEAGLANNESSRDQQRMSLYLWAQARTKASRSKVYTYFWTHTLPGPDAAKYGAFHTSEVPYALNRLYNSNRPFTAADRKIADTMSSYWANFAKTGDPNGKGLPHWPAAVTESPDTTMQIGDDTTAIAIVSSPARLAFWREYFSRPRPAQPPLVMPASR
ncbi:MAG TPA: carboxylesterase family protein [Bryobacteraceae bacterium]|nr:carboxylesterase family protein [Bryobacteraceae bacterium]